jgi:hypothetical protein
MAEPTTFGPPVRIDGPLPVAPLYSLINTAEIVQEPDERWANGVQVYPYPVDLGDSWDPCFINGSLADKAEGTPPPLPRFSSFTAYLPETCTSSRIVSQDYFTARAALAFVAVESAIYEDVLATGGAFHGTSQPYMGDTNMTVLGGGAVSPEEALALLEDAIGGTHKRGLIHATPATLTAWTFSGPSIDKEGTNLQTRVGTNVVVGDGYIGVQPDGQAAAGPKQAWAFATGPVQIRRSPNVTIMPDELSQALNRAENIVTYRAERDALIDWDTQLQVGVLVDRSIP